MKNSSLLSEKLDGMNFEFRKVLTGQKEQLPRWKRGIQRVGSRYGLGSLLGKLYVERHFPPSSKEKMIDLVNNLRQAFRNRIEAIDWMTEETKKEAYRKLSSFEPKIGYPENWGDLTAIEIDQAELFLNARRIQNFFQKRDIRKLGKKTDRTEWFMSAHNVNAYYMASFNQIVFPAGILEAPFFDPLADPAVNYGAIGGVIGHEMGHGFDDQGSKYDSTGTKRNWWTSLDRKNFEKKTTLLVQQYDSFEVIPGYHIDGAFTLGENIGDLGGLEIAFEAYKISMQGKEDVILNGLSGAQRFFLAWAQTWRGSSRNEFLVRQLKSDPHSPQKYRVNGVVRNMSSWYEAFGVNSRHELYLPENLRSSIW
jgi:putative endopeptidase